MEERSNGVIRDEKILKETPQLIMVLKEMKDGLDMVTTKVQALTAKVKAKQFPTAEGITYLEAKHLLLLSYCHSLVYYLLRKAKGLSIEGHPVVQSLVEIRLFLEKIRPIDKKCGYRIDRLLTAAKTDSSKQDVTQKAVKSSQKSEDLLKYRPNPDMLISKNDMDANDHGGVYKPPKFAPTTMEDDTKKSKHERDAQRKSKDTLRRVRESDYVRSLLDDVEGRPEEIKESIGAGSKDFSRFVSKWEKREQQEEEAFSRAPITKADKRKIKMLKKANGLAGLADGFMDEIGTLPLGDGADGPDTASFGGASRMDRRHKKRKRKF